jgi:hypothetical protein
MTWHSIHGNAMKERDPSRESKLLGYMDTRTAPTDPWLSQASTNRRQDVKVLSRFRATIASSRVAANAPSTLLPRLRIMNRASQGFKSIVFGSTREDRYPVMRVQASLEKALGSKPNHRKWSDRQSFQLEKLSHNMQQDEELSLSQLFQKTEFIQATFAKLMEPFHREPRSSKA